MTCSLLDSCARGPSLRRKKQEEEEEAAEASSGAWSKSVRLRVVWSGEEVGVGRC